MHMIEQRQIPANSSRFFRLVVPTTGAVTLVKVHAVAIWAIDTPRFFAISSTLLIA
jgi:hypothetical protein